MTQPTSSNRMIQVLKEREKEQKSLGEKVYNWKNDSAGMNVLMNQSLKNYNNTNSTSVTNHSNVNSSVNSSLHNGSMKTKFSDDLSFNSRQTAIADSNTNDENTEKSSYTVSLASTEASKLRSLQAQLEKLEKNTENARTRTINTARKALEGRKKMYERRLKDTSKKFLDILNIEKELEGRLKKQKEIAQYIMTNIFK